MPLQGDPLAGVVLGALRLDLVDLVAGVQDESAQSIGMHRWRRLRHPLAQLGRRRTLAHTEEDVPEAKPGAQRGQGDGQREGQRVDESAPTWPVQSRRSNCRSTCTDAGTFRKAGWQKKTWKPGSDPSSS